MQVSNILASEFSINLTHAENIIALVEDQNTVPFIARYRKEMTGGIDDQVLREFCNRLEYLKNLLKRKLEVQKSIEEQDKWSDELAEALQNAMTLAEVEDIYRPFKKKKTTRASIAIGKGLKPLADIILAQNIYKGEILQIAAQYIDAEKGVHSAEEALGGAKDIVAEVISDDASARKLLREYLYNHGMLSVKGVAFCDEEEKNQKAATYQMYFDYSERVATIPSHRILAVNRGEKEDCLKVNISVETDALQAILFKVFVKRGSITTYLVEDAAADALKRLIFPSIEREIRNELTDKASEQAIKIFETNLKPLLMQPPLKGRIIMGIDPAYRTGCKVAVIDDNANCLATEVVYPTPPQNKTQQAFTALSGLIAKYKVDAIAIGNGTANKETEIFVADMIKQLDRRVQYIVVNEAGASVYSASKLAAEEFPDFDVSIRSAVSIARRLLDPLSELIKIDVKAIGVGQYQHDLPQKRLTEALDGVVEDCVNKVGVDINTASASLLSYVAGINAACAKNIIEKRKKKPFKARHELLKIKGLGDKAFAQCAGFLRVTSGENILDNTGVHPESYSAVEKLLGILNYSDSQKSAGAFSDILDRLAENKIEEIAAKLNIGVPTLRDAAVELQKPGRDVREGLPQPLLRDDLMSIDDLKEGMCLDGTVRNVVDFGAFIDIGVGQDGLAHISELANRYIKHPSEVVKVGDVVKAWIVEIDKKRKRIGLTLKGDSGKGDI